MTLASKAMTYEVESDKTVHYDRKQVIRNATKWDDLPTREVLRRLYKRHKTVLFEAGFVLTWVGILYHAVATALF